MIRRAIRCGSMLLIAGCLASCREYFPTFPLDEPAVTPFIIGLDSLYMATEGELLAIGFEVKVIDSEGMPVVGMPVNVSLDEDGGSLAIPEFTTNTDGIVQVLYYNHLPFTDYTVQIQTMVKQDTASAVFDVRVKPKPASIAAEPEVNFLFARAGKRVETSVAFRVTNPKGIPVPNVDVAFRIVSGDAAIETIAYTDVNGLVRAFLTLEPSKSSEIIVKAEVRFVELPLEEESRRALLLKLLKNIPKLRQSYHRRALMAITTLKVVII